MDQKLLLYVLRQVPLTAQHLQVTDLLDLVASTVKNAPKAVLSVVKPLLLHWGLLLRLAQRYLPTSICCRECLPVIGATNVVYVGLTASCLPCSQDTAAGTTDSVYHKEASSQWPLDTVVWKEPGSASQPAVDNPGSCVDLYR